MNIKKIDENKKKSIKLFTALRVQCIRNTILENLYLSKPIVSTKCIEFIEKSIVNGKNGLLVDIENSNDLAKAILDYKVIDTGYKIIDFNSSVVEDVFLNVIS